MDFRLWLENIEPIDVKIKQLKDIIDNNDYMTAAKKMVVAGVPFTDEDLKNFQNLFSQTGHRLKERIYQFLAHVNTVSTAFDPDLPNKIIATLKKVKTDFGFKEIDVDNISWHYFQVDNLDDSKNIRSGSLEKLHFKVNPDNLKQIYDLAAIIRKNSQFFTQFKVLSDYEENVFGGANKTDKNLFAYRRDNFIAYLSDLGAKNMEKVKRLFSGINFEVGQDYRDKSRFGRTTLSHTETKSIELALEMLKKHPNFKPGSRPDYYRRLFSLNELPYLKNKLGIDIDLDLPLGPPPQPKPTERPISPTNLPPKLIIQGEKGEMTFDSSSVRNRFWGREDAKKILPEQQAKFFSQDQFIIRKLNQGWFLISIPNLPNKTIINGKILAIPTKLNVNDKIGLQGESGKQVIPLTVKAI